MIKKQSLMDRMKDQGKRILAAAQGEISRLESQLDGLRQEAERWGSLLQGGGRKPGRPAGRGRVGRSGPVAKRQTAQPRPVSKSPTVDWAAVLGRLPKNFGKPELEKATPGLGKYPKARVMALARWSRGKHIRKIADGKYRKI